MTVIIGRSDYLLRVKQVAVLLAVSTATVYELVERKKLACVRVSNAIRFHPDDIATYIAASRT